MSNDDLITKAKAAKLLGVHPRTVNSMLADGRLIGYKLGDSPNSPVRIRLRDVQRMMRQIVPSRPTDRLTPEQRAEVKAIVAKWPKLTEAQRERVRALFDGHDLSPIRKGGAA